MLIQANGIIRKQGLFEEIQDIYRDLKADATLFVIIIFNQTNLYNVIVEVGSDVVAPQRPNFVSGEQEKNQRF